MSIKQGATIQYLDDEGVEHEGKFVGYVEPDEGSVISEATIEDADSNDIVLPLNQIRLKGYPGTNYGLQA